MKGGPLIIPGDNPEEDIEIGIVSWGTGCGDSPAVYARVSQAYEWITESVCGDDKNEGGSNDPPRSLCPRSKCNSCAFEDTFRMRSVCKNSHLQHDPIHFQYLFKRTNSRSDPAAYPK